MFAQKIHHKYTHCLESMILNTRVDLPYFGYFNQPVNFFEKKDDPQIKTAGVNVTVHGMNHYYNPAFLDGMTQEEVNFLMLHETFHLLLDHPQRTRNGGYDHQLSNIAQDMIINQLLVRDISSFFISVPKDKEGKNTALFLPKEYEGEWIFEDVYDYLKAQKDDSEKRSAKKEDEKIFNELFALPNVPLSAITNHNGAFNLLLDILIEKSKQDCTNYMSNFVRRCLVSFQMQKPVYLYGHTSTVKATGIDNQTLSQNRAELFKSAVIEQIELEAETNAYCMALLEKEMATVSSKDKINFIINYEVVTNETLKKQRLKDLSNEEEMNALYQSYRFTELSKLNVIALNSMCVKEGVAIPNVSVEKANMVNQAKTMLIAEGKGDTELLIVNETDELPSIVRDDLKKLPQYKLFKNITESGLKQAINRRLTYKFDEAFENSLGGGSSCESKNQNNQDGYGQNGHDGQECYDLDTIFSKMEDNNGEFLDNHIPDTVSSEMREQIVKDVQERLKQRGLLKGNVEKTLDSLKKKRKDYLSEIKRAIAFIKGSIKQPSIKRINRRGVVGLKGKIKQGYIINVILDTSGSMSGSFENALSYIFRNDIEVNLVQCDTAVQATENIKNKKQLEKLKIKGLGGTTLQPGIDYIKDNFAKYPTLVLTDGYTDTLDFSGYNQKVLIISNGVKCPIQDNGRIKQIVITE